MPKKLVALRLDPEQIEGLERVKARTGAPIAEQVRRAIVRWLATEDVKTERKRVGTRNVP